MLALRHYLILKVLTFLLITSASAQWQAQDPGYPEGMAPLGRLAIVDENTIWTVGRDEIGNTPYSGFSKTTDGGMTWTLDSIVAEDLDNFFFSYIFALNDSVAWVTMMDEITPVHRGRLFKTSDSGKSWQHQSTAYPDDDVIAHLPSYVHFFDENNGLTAGYYGDHYVTSDGGETWLAVPEENRPDLIGGNERPNYAGLSVAGDSTAWYGTNKGRVFKTTNRGNSWSAYDVGLGTGSIYASFKDEQNGLATNPLENRNIAKTIDGGETWQILPDELPINAILFHVRGTENTYSYGSGDLPLFGEILGKELDPGHGFTSDDGQTWQFTSSTLLEPYDAINSSMGWAAGGTNDGLIYKWVGSDLDANYSTENWQAYYPGFPDTINAWTWSVADENTVWIMGNNLQTQPAYQEFRKTSDGGNSWSAGSIPAGGEFYFAHVFAVDEDTAWVAAGDNSITPPDGRVYQSTDGGDNWEIKLNVTSPNFVHFFDNKNGLVVGDGWGEGQLFIYTTTDGGDTWDRVSNTNIPALINSGDLEQPTNSNYTFAGKNSLWFGTNKGRVFGTNDRGFNWFVADLELGTEAVYPSFQDDLTGLATCPGCATFPNGNTTVLKTTDGGITWNAITEEVPIMSIIRYVTGTDNTFIYGSAGFGTAYDYEDGNGYSNNSGDSWSPMDNLPIIPPLFINNQVGWAGTNTDNLFYKYTGPAFPDKIVSVETSKVSTPNKFALGQNYPNPFNPKTVINYQLSMASNVELTVYNILGEKVVTLVSGKKSAGNHTVTFDASSLSSGVFFYTLKTGNHISHKKMILLK